MEKDPDHTTLLSIEHHAVAGIVDEALHALHHAPDKIIGETIKIYSDSCLVISLIFHWLVLTMCKRLMQLVVPEALASLHTCIPTYYIENYLMFQEHFSLKSLVVRRLKDLRSHNG